MPGIHAVARVACWVMLRPYSSMTNSKLKTQNSKLTQRFWPLLLLLALVLFPFGWLGEQIPGFGLFLGWLFASAREHAIGHTLLFLLLGLAALFPFPGLARRPWHYLGLMLLVAIFQEGFQLLYKARPLVFDDFRDLVTDMIGSLLALGLIRVWRWKKHQNV